MICPYCHAENIEGSDTCVECGQALYGLDLPDAEQGSQAPEFIRQPLAALPKREIVGVGRSDPVGLAIREMKRRNTNFVLVMDGERMAGIITDRDILEKVAGPNEDLNAVTCAQVMTPDPQALHDDDTVAAAIYLMAAGGFRHVPIVDDGRPLGVLVVDDLFRYISPQLV